MEPDLTHSMSDVLFSAKFDGRDGYLYLLVEHQSKPDPMMAYRLLKYMINICDRHLTLHPESKTIPLVYPILFYNGKQKYNVARNAWDLFVDPALARGFWTKDYQLVNLREIPDSELTKHDWYGSLAFLMKHIYERDLAKK